MNITNFNCDHSNGGSYCTDCLVSKYRVITSDYFSQKAPLIEKNIRVCDSYNTWYNADIKQAKRRLRKAEKLFKKHKSDFHRDEFKKLRQLKCELVYRAKVSFYGSKVDKFKNDSRKLYGVLNGLLGFSNAQDILPQCGSDFILANKFKDFFLKKVIDIKNSFDGNFGTNEYSLIPDFPLKYFENFKKVEFGEMVKIMGNVNKTFCLNDPFDIRSVEIDKVLKPLASYYCSIVNSSFNEGKFPQTEKFSCVKPRIKGKCNPEELSSYRPLYNTSFLSKVLESAALAQLLDHLKKFESFPRVQSAYREFHSVETATCRIYNDLVVRKCNGDCTLLVLLDLSAAFDTVDHDILMRDLSLLGVQGKVSNWFYSFLNDRDFSVIIGKNESDRAKMVTGVPQGSILGPVLFTVYTIELFYLLDSLNVECHFYADDTQIYFTVLDLEQGKAKFHEIYTAVESWMFKRKLKLNSGKTEIMLVGSQSKLEILNNLNDMTVGTSIVTLSKQVKSLGVVIDQSLSLKQQINYTKKKAVFNLMNISRISRFINESARMKLVHGLVFSVIDFCNSIYYGLPNSDLHGLQIILNSAARIVTGMPRFSRDRITPVCIKLHFLPIKARIIYKLCLITYKALKFNQPKYLSELLKTYNPETSMNLRSIDENRLNEPVVSRSAVVKRSFEYSAPRLFNMLPIEIRQTNTVKSFKKSLKTYLFTQAYDISTQSIRSDFKV